MSHAEAPAVLAVDGGNTKTIALVVTADGRVLGEGRGGCSDIYGAPTPGAALAVLVSTSVAALEKAGLAAGDLAAAAFSLAGADWPEDFALLRGELPRRLGLAAEPLVVNDALGALRSAGPEWAGIAVVYGTGRAVGARHPNGRGFHLGFWADGAGGRQLGRDGLRAVYRAELGMTPPTALTELALARYGAPSVLALLHDFTRRGGRAEAEQDLLAPDVLGAADRGDAIALDIVRAQARVTGAQARVSAQRVGLPLAGTPVVLTGGVLTHPSRLLGDLTMAELPCARRVEPVQPPIVGAALLALDRIGAQPNPNVIAAGLSGPLDLERSAPWRRSRSIV